MQSNIGMVKSKFSHFADSPFREYQEEAIQHGLRDVKKVGVLCLPTGAGKSLIGSIVASIYGNSCYLVHSRPLQVQLQNDLPELPIMWGRSNYDCMGRANTTCDMCIKCDLHDSRCLYVMAKRAAVNSPVSILNYEYWITESNYVGQFGDMDMVVIDEADSLEMAMTKFISLDFTDGMLRNLHIPYPNYKTLSSENALDDWRGWARFAVNKVNVAIKAVNARLVNDPEDAESIKRLQNLTGITHKLNMFIDHVDEKWICDIQEYDGRKSISFKPIWIPVALAEKYVWSHGRRFNLMSATFPPVTVMAKTLGLNVADIDYREFPSTFPVENRPIILDPVVNMTYKTMDEQFEVLKARVKELMDKHKDEKGIIHCVSYKVCREIMSIGDERLITHDARNKIANLELFKTSDFPYVFVSPSSERGVSLDNDMCRFVIWAKAPFLSLADKVVAARVYGSQVGRLWYLSDMLQTVVQGCGRAVRSKEDHATVHILDHQIVKCLSDNPGMVPRWWRDAI